MTREQVGWVRFDGDEYHDFRYASPEDKRLPASVFADLLPVYVDVAQPRVERPDPTIITRDSWGNAMVPVVIALIAGLIVLLLVVFT